MATEQVEVRPSAPVPIEVCAVCGVLVPRKLWSGAKVVAGGVCAHREKRTVWLLRERPEELAELVATALFESLALLDEDDKPAPRDHYVEAARHVIGALFPTQPKPNGAPHGRE